MNQLFQQLIIRKEILSNLMITIRENEKKLPEGKLRISNDKGNLHYYYITEPSDTHGKYIPKKDYMLVRNLAQKDYQKQLYKEAERELKDINMFLAKYGETHLEDIYMSLNKYRKEIVEPIVVSDDIYIKEWEAETYATNPFHSEEQVYPTKKNELVRSKSEVLLADMYYDMGIPYRYEAELCLKNGKKKYPDFTILDIRNRTVIYHEHLGMLDKEEYRQNNLRKIEEYRKDGIFLGKNLIVTYEAEGVYLNINEVKEMIRAMLEM